MAGNARDLAPFNMAVDSNLRAVQMLLVHPKRDCSVRYLGGDTEDALSLPEGIDPQRSCRPTHLVRGGPKPPVGSVSINVCLWPSLGPSRSRMPVFKRGSSP
jgi:hypothetical protein